MPPSRHPHDIYCHLQGQELPMSGKTLYDKVWEAHAVKSYSDGTTLLYIDRHLVHEVSSPQAFAHMKATGRTPWRRDAHLCVADHAVPTVDRDREISDPQ